MEYLDKPKWALDLEKRMDELKVEIETHPEFISKAPCLKPFWERLTEHLIACGAGFYRLCPGFSRIAQLDPYFDPAIEAGKLKEEELNRRIEALEAAVKNLSAKKG